MGKTLVVGCLLVIGLGIVGVAGPLSGFAYSALWLDLSGSDIGMVTVWYPGFVGVLDIDYRVCSFTLGATALLEDGVGLGYLLFDASGWLGPVYGSSFMVIDAVNERFYNVQAIAWLGIGGVDVYAYGLLKNTTAQAPPVSGLGYAVGAQGMVGDCSIAVEAQFNLRYPVRYYPVDIMCPRDPTTGDYPHVFENYRWDMRGWSCLLYEPGTNFFQGYLPCGGEAWRLPWGLNDVVQTGCSPAFSGIDVLANFPFACVDLWVQARFSCDVGFDFVEFQLFDICLLPWLELDFLKINFTVQTKSLAYDFDLILFDCLCIDPIFELVINDTTVDGITLRGLTTSYEVSPGVLFKAGTIFQPDDPNAIWVNKYFFDAQGNPFPSMGDPDVDPDIVCPPYFCNTYSFARYAWYDEYLAIIVDGDSCCGGAFTVSIFNWFDAGDDNLTFGPNPAGVFDWEQTEIAFSVGIGSNVTLLGGLSVTNDDLEYLKIGAQFVF